jgi:hypothetical protein
MLSTARTADYAEAPAGLSKTEVQYDEFTASSISDAGRMHLTALHQLTYLVPGAYPLRAHGACISNQASDLCGIHQR